MYSVGVAPANVMALHLCGTGLGAVSGLADEASRGLGLHQQRKALRRACKLFDDDAVRRGCVRASAIENGRQNGETRAFSKEMQPRRSRISSPLVSILPVVTPVQDAEDSADKRLRGEIDDLRQIQRSLLGLKGVEEKMAVIDNCKRVRRVFGRAGSGIFVKPAVALAMHVLEAKDLYLLKCLVAAGQEHVFDASFAWQDLHRCWDASGSAQESDVPEASAARLQGHLLKDAFVVLAQMIDHLDGPGSKLVNGNGAWTAPSAGKHWEQSSLAEHDGGVSRRLHSLLFELVNTLSKIDEFYDCIGGIIGYQLAALELIEAFQLEREPQSMQGNSLTGSRAADDRCFHVPSGPDLSVDTAYATQAVSWGLQGVPVMGEIYPLGGAGDRLGLVDAVTGECLPVAMLPYCGRTLLEGLVRDLQAREYLHFQVFGEQHVTPIAIMSSAAKRNNERVLTLCESLGWFGRGQDNFMIFEQPLVPTVAAADGRWLVSEPLSAVLKPGGHGVIWKLAKDAGVFEWFHGKGRKAAIVRQISNPVAGTDVTLLALSGIGLHHNKKFGFASCKRNVGTAEGVNVLVERRISDDRWEYGVTCIEYTEFSKLGIPDVPVSPGSMEAQYPANTNVLYVDLEAVEEIASSQSLASLPGMILNLNKPVNFIDFSGHQHSILAGRLECTMQNVADSLTNQVSTRHPPKSLGDIDTFITYNHRRKVTSSAKRRRKPNEQSLHQTPDGSFLDLTRNGYDILTSCGVTMPVMENNHCYVDAAPPFMVLFHPALGPLWDVIRQKICGGSLAEGSELQLEIAEFAWRNVHLDGCLLVQAKNVMGSMVKTGSGEQLLRYGQGCGRCRLEGVKVVNKGVDWGCTDNIYWQQKLTRLESTEIILEGDSEFEAFDVVFKGAHIFRVPDGYKMRVLGTEAGFCTSLEPLSDHSSWYWNYTVQGAGHIHLTMQENCYSPHEG